MAVRKCLTEGCERWARMRGVCNRCYSRLYTLVKNGSSSFESLEDAGRILPSGADRSKTYLRRQVFGVQQ